jgi:hypothetical protein
MPVNPYDQAAADLFSGQAAVGVRSSVMSVADRNPDAEAKVQKQASQHGVPYESARNNPQLLTQRSAASAVDYDNLARTAPATTKFLSNPANAAVSHDDVGVIGGIEHWFTNTGKYVGQKFVSGLHSAGAVGAQVLNDAVSSLQDIAAKPGQIAEDIASIGKPAAEQKALMLRHLTAPRGSQGLQQFAVKQQQTANRISQRADLNAGTSDYAYATLDPSKSALLSPTKMAGDLAQGLPALTAFMLSKGQAASVLGTYMGAAQQVDVLSSLGDAEVQKSPAYKSLVNAGVDPRQAAQYVKSKTAADEGMASGAINTLLAGLAGPLGAKAGGSLWKGLGLDSMSWGAMGAGSQLATNTVEKVDVNPDKNVLEGVGEAFLSNATQGAIFHGITHIVGSGIKATQRTEDAQQTHEALKEFTDLATASKLRERAPGTFHDLVEAMADGSPVENVYVHPDKMVEAMDALHQGEIEPEQLAKIENVVGPRLKDAIEQGTDVELPIADYAAHLTGTGADKVLLDHLKVDPSGMTKAEAEEFMQTKGEELKQEVERTLARVGVDDDRANEVQQVKQQVLQQLNSANRFTPNVNERYADLHAAFYSTLADRLGVSPNTLYERYPIRIVNKAMSDSHFAQRYDDLLSNIGKKPSARGIGNDNSDTPGLSGPAGERVADLKPVHERYQEGDVLSYKGEVGRVLSANDKSVTLKTPSGDHIVPRDHADLKVAPLSAWADEYHQGEKPIFYSELERAVEGSKQAKASGRAVARDPRQDARREEGRGRVDRVARMAGDAGRPDHARGVAGLRPRRWRAGRGSGPRQRRRDQIEERADQLRRVDDYQRRCSAICSTAILISI